jgi:dipeptidyl aminopeptidase/acylaminoacyl peptidase
MIAYKFDRLRIARGWSTSTITDPVLRLATSRGIERSRIVLVGFLMLLSVTGCGHDRPHGHTDMTFSLSPQGDKLVFNAVGNGGRDLYLLDLKTMRVDRVASTPTYEVDPSYSQDGKLIVYAAGQSGDRADHIFVRSLDTGHVTQITREDANDSSPSFSPDGSLVVFARSRTYKAGGLASNWSGLTSIYLVGPNGFGLRQLSTDRPLTVAPRFTNDGRMIYSSTREGYFTIAVDGTEPPRPLNSLHGKDAVYSPDGRFIAYTTGHYAHEGRIVISRADGSETRQIAYPAPGKLPISDGGCSRPIFTADGRRVIFNIEVWPDGPRGAPKKSLWEVEVEGGQPCKLASFELFDDPLSWNQKRGHP